MQKYYNWILCIKTITVTDVGSATTEGVALTKIDNAAKAKVWDGVTIADFTTAGVTGVTAGNFLDVKSGVQNARALKGAALTTAEIQSIVNPLVVSGAISAINAGNATVQNYTDAGITGVTASNLTAVNATVAAAKLLQVLI